MFKNVRNKQGFFDIINMYIDIFRKNNIEKNDIDKVLIIMNYDLLLNSIFDIEWEE